MHNVPQTELYIYDICINSASFMHVCKLCLRHVKHVSSTCMTCLKQRYGETELYVHQLTTSFTTSCTTSSLHNMPQTEVYRNRVYTYTKTASTRLHSVDVCITTSFTPTLLLALLLALLLGFSSMSPSLREGECGGVK